VLELAQLLIGVALLFGIPMWAAWTTWPHRRWYAASAAIGWTASWCALCLWLALR
jgi:hypothetical protein